jgi:opacity protein-like surface antigen
MRKFMIAAALVSTATATPALARDGSAYVGIDAGVQSASRLTARFTNANVSINNAEMIKHKLGYDVDAVFGYDFGMFRVEGELGYKHADFKNATIATAVYPAINGSAGAVLYDAAGTDSVLSGMVNALLDLGPRDGPSASIGGGIGEARERVRVGLFPSNALNFRSEDSGFAWQILAEARFPVTSNLDAGLKFRHFEASVDFGPFCVTSCGATPSFHLHNKYRSNSLLASLVYNFAGAAPPPPPPPAPPPPPPPPPPPATQTCPDGSVIPATATCPAPPPPPPPPAQRGERGE